LNGRTASDKARNKSRRINVGYLKLNQNLDRMHRFVCNLIGFNGLLQFASSAIRSLLGFAEAECVNDTFFMTGEWEVGRGSPI
jgi:hypothetical protein